MWETLQNDHDTNNEIERNRWWEDLSIVTPLSANNGKDRKTSESSCRFFKITKQIHHRFCFCFFFFCYRIFQHFVNLNTTQGQLLPSRANNLIKRQEEDDRRKSGRIMTFNR